MKKLAYAITALAVIFLLSANIPKTEAALITVKDFVKSLGVQAVIDQANIDTNGHFTETNVNGDPLSVTELTGGQVQGPVFEIINELGSGFYVPAWGSPHGDKDKESGQSRYLGYTKLGEDFTNPAFPHDAWAGGKLEDRNWISEPWLDGRTKNGIQKTDYDGKPDFLPNIRLGLTLYYKDVLAGAKERPEFWSNLQNYVHVLTPPSSFTWGLGRMWHQREDGSIWYISIPLAPTDMIFSPDASVKLEPKQVKAKQGDEVTFTATVKLKQAPQKTIAGVLVGMPYWYVATLAVHDVNGQKFAVDLVPAGGSPQPDGDGYVKLDEGVEYKYNVKVHAQSTDSTLYVAVYPELYEDLDESDNGDYAEIHVEQVNLKVTDITLSPDPGEPGQLTSGTITVKNESGQEYKGVKVAWKVRHQDGSDLDGNTIVTDLAAGESKALPFTFTPDVAGTCSVAAMVNPFHDNPPNEVNWLSGDWPGDNRKEVPYDVKGKDYDIKVEIVPGRGNPWKSMKKPADLWATVKVTRKDNLQDTLPVRLSIDGDGGPVTEEFNLEPGGRHSYEYHIKAYSSGNYTINAEAWPSDDSWQDIYPPDNTDSHTIQYVYNPPPAPIDKEIHVELGH